MLRIIYWNLESTIIKLTGENEALRDEIDSLKKILLYENTHTVIRADDQAEDHKSPRKEWCTHES